MLRDRLNQLFKGYDPTIQAIIHDVLILEQEHISLERPRIKDQIESIISRQAEKELDQLDHTKDQGK